NCEGALPIGHSKHPSEQTNENKTDRVRWTASTSSTNGAPVRRAASTKRSCTVEKRRNLNRFNTGFIERLDCAVSLIQFSTSFQCDAGTALSEQRKWPDKSPQITRLVRKCARVFASI